MSITISVVFQCVTKCNSSLSMNGRIPVHGYQSTPQSQSIGPELPATARFRCSAWQPTRRCRRSAHRTVAYSLSGRTYCVIAKADALPSLSKQAFFSATSWLRVGESCSRPTERDRQQAAPAPLPPRRAASPDALPSPPGAAARQHPPCCGNGVHAWMPAAQGREQAPGLALSLSKASPPSIGGSPTPGATACPLSFATGVLRPAA